jgi:hypothetical protein
MLVKNASKRLICIDGKRIIPLQQVEIPDNYANHPVVAEMLKKKELVDVADENQSTKDFSKMTVKEIEAFAQEHGIDLTGATNKEEKIALVQAAVSGQ